MRPRARTPAAAGLVIVLMLAVPHLLYAVEMTSSGAELLMKALSPQTIDALRRAGAAAAAEVTAHPSGHQRALLQNADVPALNKYGGKTMKQLVPPGYPLEQHRAVTPDGWVLNMFRIPHGKYRHASPGPRPVVLLHHGITLDSACFVPLGANQSLALILADAGFDVWMANTRGNTYSRGNYNNSYRDAEYWYHTIDEYALIDGPTQIDKALAVSGAKKLAFVGHSQGCTIGYAMLAALPEMASKVSVVAHLGPVVFLEFFMAPVLRNMALATNDRYFTNVQWGEFLWYRLLAPFIPVCNQYIWSDLCLAGLNIMLFGPSKFMGPDDLTLVLQTWPASVSGRNVIHWAQMINDDVLALKRFDFGTNCANRTRYFETCNQAAYGSLSPPVYDLGAITVPQALFVGEIDLMAVNKDVDEQIRLLSPGVHVATYVYEQLAHMDFVWDANMRFATDLVDLMYRYAPGTF